MALKDLRKGTVTKLGKLNSKESKTVPPSRYSEVKLVSDLENRGIGRPATFSSIVSLIQERGYVAKKGTQLYPTPLGFAVARLLSAKFPSFTAYDYTSKMEDELDDIAQHKKNRVGFLDSFWNGNKGFENVLEELSEKIDFSEIEKYSTIDLHNGYSVKHNRFGTFLQNNKGEPDEKGFLPSVRVDDDVDVWDYKDVEKCEEEFKNFSNKKGSVELGVLDEGEYEGWTVWVKDGKYGTFLQAVPPKITKEEKKSDDLKPVNHKIPGSVDADNVELKDVKSLFMEIKLPRWSPDKKWLVGVGKKGPYMGYKKTVKSKPVFRTLPEDFNPRTVSFQKVQELWNETEK